MTAAIRGHRPRRTSVIFGKDNFYSHGDEDDPARTMLHSWLFCLMIPAGILAWFATRQVLAVVGATLAPPLLAIAQGAVGILSFRVHFGDAPLPQTPSHGVVVVNPKDVESRQSSTTSGVTDESRDDVADDDEESSRTDKQEALLLDAVQQPPVRLLVIGDSLAIGVGQSQSSTPVMPEVIAKTLSKRLGRVVYWTCHGAPGASTGWVVRELERGVDYLGKQKGDDSERTLSEEDDEYDIIPSGMVEVQSSCSDTTDESSSDESSSENEQPVKSKGAIMNVDERHLDVWRERLQHHRKRFNPEVLGPYDIVVVVTGSNDLKSAFFPFLLTGEDAEFRRQAQQRGGSYTNELRRLLETLDGKMRRRLFNIRATVEAARDTMRDKMEVTMERIAPGSSSRLNRRRACQKYPPKRVFVEPETNTTHAIQRGNSRNFPLVVLPGMPARALPIFRIAPLRWLSIPIVDIMDTHKRNLANMHPGEVLFVRAPSVYDLAQYEQEQGRIWNERCQEDTVLSLKDIRKRERRRIEAEMSEYFREKGALHNGGLFSPLSSRLGPAPGASIFSVDQIHPNDRGYDFWGRYIASAIVEEWHEKTQH